MFAARARDGVLLVANAGLASVLGRPPERLCGHPVAEVLVERGRSAAVQALLQRSSPVRREEVSVSRADGVTCACLLSVVRVEQEGEVLLVGGLEDVTELRDARAALERAHQDILAAQARLVQAEKMASLGMLVAGIAHEIKTPIGAVASMHHTLVKATDKLSKALVAEGEGGPPEALRSEKISRLLDVIRDANRVIADGTGRVTTIVKRLKSFARLDGADVQEVDLNEGLQDTLVLIQHELKHTVTIHRELGPLPPVACFPGQLKQVFLNLLMNARQAMPGGGDLWIRSWAEADHVCVQIEDSGVGIPPDALPRIFEPGFTTKSANEGTGLGLSICKRILEAHHGELSVESEEGTGARFTVRVPRDLRARLAQAGSEASEPARPHE